MARDDGGYWLPIHTGLLRDERWAGMTPVQRGAWITVFLLLDGEPRHGWFRDRDRIVWHLRRDGWSAKAAEQAVSDLESTGWIVTEPGGTGAVSLRGWNEYTGATARKAVNNAARGDRGDRSAEYARRKQRRREMTGAVGRPRRDETTQDVSVPSPARSGGGAGPVRVDTGMKSFKELSEDFGFDPATIGAKRVARNPDNVLTDGQEGL